MLSKTERVYIDFTASKAEVEAYDGPYFFEKGVELESDVQEKHFRNCLSASFDGFQVLSEAEQQQVLLEAPEEPSITARLFYFIERGQR